MVKNRIRRIVESLLILLIVLIAMLLLGGTMEENKTAHFFEGIEIQCETAEQREIIIEALNDMLTLSENELKKKEYPDTFRKGGRINIQQVIYSYFVPDDSKKSLDYNFYKELRTKEVRELIVKLLDKLRGDKKAEENIIHS